MCVASVSDPEILNAITVKIWILVLSYKNSLGNVKL